MRAFVIIQARLNSSRLPGKILYNLCNKTVIEWCIYRSKKIKKINGVLIAAPKDSFHKPLKSFFNSINCDFFLGDEKDLLSRYYYAAKSVQADKIIRITSDCPLIDPNVVDSLFDTMIKEKLDFITNMAPPSWPHGLDVSIFNMQTLKMAYQNAKYPSDREHVVPWMWRNCNINNKKLIKGRNIKYKEIFNNYRWTIDTIDDYLFFKKLESCFGEILFSDWDWKFIIKNINNHKINSKNLIADRDIDYWKTYIEENK